MKVLFYLFLKEKKRNKNKNQIWFFYLGKTISWIRNGFFLIGEDKVYELGMNLESRYLVERYEISRDTFISSYIYYLQCLSEGKFFGIQLINQ